MSTATTETTEHLPATVAGAITAQGVGGLAWADAVAAFLTNASRSGSEHTTRAYRRHLVAFGSVPLGVGAHALPPVRTLADVMPARLMAWRAYVMQATRPDGREWSAGSKAQAIAAVRAFMRFAYGQGWHDIPSDRWGASLAMPPGDAARPFDILTDAEAGRLLATPQVATTVGGRERSTERKRRDTAMLTLMLGAGLRAHEVVGLETRDVMHGEGGTVVAVRGKGGKSRTVPVRDEVAGAVLAYIAATDRRMGDRGALFTREGDRSGKHLTTRTVGALMAEFTKAAGIMGAGDGRKVSPHSTRHTYAVRNARHGASVETLRRLLGHSSVATTGRYLDHLGMADLRDALAPLPGHEALPA